MDGEQPANVTARLAANAANAAGRGLIVRFDERFPLPRIAAMDDHLVFEVQRLYPQIYLACHVDHVRTTSTSFSLSSHDSSILAHLDVGGGMSPGDLAGHLGVVPSTLSASLARLEQLGYIVSTPRADDKRKRDLALTPCGAQAMASTSVLDTQRVRQLLESMTPTDREAGIRGLALLGAAARRINRESGK